MTVRVLGVAGGPEAGGRTGTAISGLAAAHGTALVDPATAVRGSAALSALVPQV